MSNQRKYIAIAYYKYEIEDEFHIFAGYQEIAHKALFIALPLYINTFLLAMLLERLKTSALLS